MKKLVLISYILAIFLVISLVISGEAMAAWTYKIKQASSVDGNNLFVEVEYTNGTKILNVNIPVFRPQNKAEVIDAIKNRFQSEKAAYLEQVRIENNIKPTIDSEVGNINPAE